jgi:hypothetical protein
MLWGELVQITRLPLWLSAHGDGKRHVEEATFSTALL